MQKITRHWHSVILILWVITFITLLYFGDAIWTDEQRTLYYAGAAPQYGLTTFAESVQRIAKNLWQAPTYYLTLWGWGRLVGWSVFAMRIPSLYFGLLAIAMTYRLALRYYGASVGFYAAATMGLNAFYINFMHDMRAYILFAMLTTFMFAWYSAIIHAKQRRFAYIGFTMTLILMLYTHYFAAFPIAALGLCHLIFRWRKKDFIPTIICFVIAGLAFLPWLNILVGGAQVASEVARSNNNLSLIAGLSNIFYLFSNGSEALLLILFLFAGATSHRKNTFIGVWLVAAYALLWGVTRIVPAFTEVKYVIYFWPALAVVAGVGIHHLQRLGVSPLILLAVWVGMFGGSLLSADEQERIHPFYTPPLDELAEATLPHTDANDSLLFVLPSNTDFVEDAMLAYYFYHHDLLRAKVVRDTFATTDDFFQTQVEDAIIDAERVWLTYQASRRNWRIGSVEDTILPSAGYAACGTVINQADVIASLYAHKPTDATPYLFAVDDTHNVEVYLLSTPVINADGSVLVTVGWYLPPEVFGSPLSIALHLEDGNNNIIDQGDIGIERADFDCAYQTLAINTAGTDTYNLKATVYNWQTGERLTSVDPSPDNRALIATIPQN